MSCNIDWEQYKRNLAKEREQWEMYEIRKNISEERMLQAIETKREELEEFIQKKKKEHKRRIRWAYKAYMIEVEKKFKSVVRV